MKISYPCTLITKIIICTFKKNIWIEEMRIGTRIKLSYYRYLGNNFISKMTRSYKVRLHTYLPIFHNYLWKIFRIVYKTNESVWTKNI